METNMNKFKPLHLMSRKERVREWSFKARKARVEDQVLLQIKRRRRRRRIFHVSMATHAINLDTMREIVIQRRGSMKPQLQMSKKTPLRRSQRMRIVQSSSSAPYVESTIWRSRWRWTPNKELKTNGLSHNTAHLMGSSCMTSLSNMLRVVHTLDGML